MTKLTTYEYAVSDIFNLIQDAVRAKLVGDLYGDKTRVNMVVTLGNQDLLKMTVPFVVTVREEVL